MTSVQTFELHSLGVLDLHHEVKGRINIIQGEELKLIRVVPRLGEEGGGRREEGRRGGGEEGRREEGRREGEGGKRVRYSRPKP